MEGCPIVGCIHVSSCVAGAVDGYKRTAPALSSERGAVVEVEYRCVPYRANQTIRRR